MRTGDEILNRHCDKKSVKNQISMKWKTSILHFLNSIDVVYVCSIMNALTQIRNTQRVSKQEIELGLLDSSWHDRFKHSAYIYVGGLPFELTEGDILAICSQYGEIVDINLVKDAKTKKSRGFAFVAYEDQRSTVLAVDNLSGSRVGGRTIRVDHVDNYRKAKREADGTPDDDDDDESLDVSVKEEEEEEVKVQDHVHVESKTTQKAPTSVPSWRDLVARREKKLEKEASKKERKRKHR